MNELKLYSIIGAIFVIITGTISHFIYEWSGQSFILGFFFPVNESTWEHMKLCFFPMLVYSLFVEKRLKIDYPCITSALLSGILLGTFLIPVFFYTYSGILGRNYALIDISIFVISVIIGFCVVYQLTLSCRMVACTTWLILLVSAMLVCFLVFTYLPPNIGLFISPTE